MKAKFYSIFAIGVMLLAAACTPNMDAPGPGPTPNNNPFEGPPQVIFLPAGVEAYDLAVSGDYLYLTVPEQDQVYRVRIADIKNLSQAGNAVTYVKVPGATGIVADDNGGLYIGSSAQNSPKTSSWSEDQFGPTTGQWASDRVIYFTHTSERWHNRFSNNPAQKLFIAPRGNFNALAWYNGSGTRRYEDGLYFATSYNLEGMGIGSGRYTESLKALSGLIPDELDFLIKMALGESTEFDINKVLGALKMVNIALVDDGIDYDTGIIDWGKVAMDNLLVAPYPIVRPTLEGPSIGFDVIIYIRDMFDTFKTGNIITDALIDLGRIAFVALIGTDEVRLSIPIPPLYLEPQWGMHLATLWSPVDLEIPFGELHDLLLTLTGPRGEVIRDMINDFLVGAIAGLGGSGGEWWEKILEYLGEQASIIAGNIVTDEQNILRLLSNYVTDPNPTRDTPVSINGNYEDQPGIYPPRPYLLPYYTDGSEPVGNPWTWNITNLSALPARPNSLGYPMTPNFDSEVGGDMNLKIALTLYLLQFKDGTPTGSFSLLQSKDDVDNFVQALTTGSILDKLKNVVDALNIDAILDYGIFDNPQLEAYLRLVKSISEAGVSDIMALLDELYEFIIKPFNISLDFNVLLNAWIDMPDWSPINVRVGQIANHSLLGGLYNSLDNFVDDQTGLIGCLSHWVSSKIPRVNSANGWDYRGPGKPTGVAFGHDGLVGDVVGWVVDDGKVYSKPISQGIAGPRDYYDRDDYPRVDTDGNEPYMLNGVPYWSPNPAYWEQRPGNRNRWSTKGGPFSGSGQKQIVVPESMALNNAYGIVYDKINQRVLVSCNDGVGPQNKGRIVSVQYGEVSPPSGALLCSGFFPPPPRISFPDLYDNETNVRFAVSQVSPIDGELNNPKGMAIKDNYIFIADGNRIVVYYMGN
ncbi:MAG: hypothetical protein FWD56_01795 [Bacteroidales bacterium]|nr:hypothetical protein [Bacteroidales bacterium]